MKNRNVLIALFLSVGFSLCLQAQTNTKKQEPVSEPDLSGIPDMKAPEIKEELYDMSAGKKPALTMELPFVDTKFVDSQWKDYMKPYGKVSKVKQAKESITEGAQILDIGGVNKLNIYYLSNDITGGTKVIVWFDIGADFINSANFSKPYGEAEKFMLNFAQQVKVEETAVNLKDQQNTLSKMESSLTKLQKERDNLDTVIENAKAKIEQAEADIVENTTNQETTQKSIDAQKAMVDAVQKRLSDLKSQKPK